jgi:cytochrome P450
VHVAELEDDPYPLFARLREEAPVAWLPELGSWVVTSRAPALEVARDPELFTVDDRRMSVRAVLGANMLTTDRPEQTRHREPFEPHLAGYDLPREELVSNAALIMFGGIETSGRSCSTMPSKSR